MLNELPDFIDPSVLNKKRSAGEISKVFYVDGIKASSFIARLKRENKEIPFEKEPWKTGALGFRKVYLVSDVINAVYKNACELTKPIEAIAKDERNHLFAENLALKKENNELAYFRGKLLSDISFLMGDLSDISPMLKKTRFNLIPKEEIVKKSKSYGSACGVYFLVKCDEIVYIGQSTNVATRVASHRDKDFDTVSFVTCYKEDLDILESLYILAYTPKLNGTIGKSDNGYRRIYTPLSLEQIINYCKGELRRL